MDGADPARPEPIGRLTGAHEERRVAGSGRLGIGTLACALCDAPVALAAGRVSPGAALACPFCGHAGAVRDFLSLAAPSRPARVVVHVGRRAALAAPDG
jgi:hypothetical protein